MDNYKGGITCRMENGIVLKSMRKKKFFGVLGFAGLLILFSLGSLSTAFASTSPAQPQLSSTRNSSNTEYTGYEVTGPYPTLRVEGSWIVPTANCTATPNSVSNISVIIDGINGEGDGMEIGTYQDCTNGVASYGAFVNIYPMTNFYGETKGNISDVVVQPGNVIEAQGTWRPSTTKGEPIDWNTNFVDETTGGVAVDTDAHSPSGFTPVLDSGALILSSNGRTLTSLSNIGSGELYTGVHDSDITGVQQGRSTFGETANTTGYTLLTWKIPNTALSLLSDDGSSFQITFP